MEKVLDTTEKMAEKINEVLPKAFNEWMEVSFKLQEKAVEYQKKQMNTAEEIMEFSLRNQKLLLKMMEDNTRKAMELLSEVKSGN